MNVEKKIAKLKPGWRELIRFHDDQVHFLFVGHIKFGQLIIVIKRLRGPHIVRIEGSPQYFLCFVNRI